MTDRVDVAVVGAGVAGLAAAQALRASGRSVAVLEATGRVGGRAWTVELEGIAFDAGASWLHDAERNPLADLARAAGDALIDADAVRTRLLFDAGRRVDGTGWERAVEAFEAACGAAAAAARDCSVAEAIAHLRGDPWMATIENWEAAQISAADPARFSVRDWAANALQGRNLHVAGGIGALVRRRLLPMAGEVRLATPVSAIDWSGPELRLETPRGTLRAGAAIVTVSVGVLAAGAIRFTPRLPAETEAAIAGLPMGLLSKVALRMADPAALGLPPDSGARRRLAAPGEASMSFHLLPGGAPLAVGFVGGPAAWALAREPEAASVAFAQAELAGMLGARASRAAFVTRWGTDPAQLGAYTYALPGQAGARAALGRPVGGGRLVFAGEATCTDGLAGTVAGAWNEGMRAAGIAGHCAGRTDSAM